jgi:hypothetical protein
MATSQSPLDGFSDEQVAALTKDDKLFLLKHDANQIGMGDDSRAHAA